MINKTDVFEFDAVVIGAGVVGLAIANELADVFGSVLVVEKEADFGQHVSSRHSGVIHSGIYYDNNSLKANLCVEGNRLLYKFCEKAKQLIKIHDDNKKFLSSYIKTD